MSWGRERRRGEEGEGKRWGTRGEEMGLGKRRGGEEDEWEGLGEMGREGREMRGRGDKMGKEGRIDGKGEKRWGGRGEGIGRKRTWMRRRIQPLTHKKTHR